MKKLIKRLLGRRSEPKTQELPNEYDYEDAVDEKPDAIPSKAKPSKLSKNLLKRLDAFEEQVNKAPNHATVGGGTYIRRGGVRKYVSFKTKDQVLKLLAEAREGKVEILLG